MGVDAIRRQPFALYVRSAGNVPVLHCVSPVGIVRDVAPTKIVELQETSHGAKLCEVDAGEADSYTLTAEGDVLFDVARTATENQTQIETGFEDVADPLVRVCVAADKVERELLEGQDAAIGAFRDDLVKEAHRA